MSDLPRLFVALDQAFDQACRTLDLLNRLQPAATTGVKIGQKLVYQRGVSAFISRFGACPAFIDVKAVDISTTVYDGIRAIIESLADPPAVITVYALGGRTIDGARQALRSYNIPTKLLAVTIPTDWTDADCSRYLGKNTTCRHQVKRLGKMAIAEGADGIICSGLETRMMRQVLGPDATIGNPGIRWPGDNAYNQKRVVTPRQALLAGADFIVMGRPVLEHESLSPRQAIGRAHADIAKALGDRKTRPPRVVL